MLVTESRAIPGCIRTLVLALAILASGHAMAQAPRTIAYQGYLTTTGGVPVSASVEMHFALYAVAIGETPIWAESQVVPVANGVYSAVLGASEPLPDPLLLPLYLGVRVGTDAEMAPRQAVAAVPYALFTERSRCNPGDIIGCSGASGSVNVGACLIGKRVCNEQGTEYGPCEGQQDPAPELCDHIDNDCDGSVDEDFPDKNANCTVGLGVCVAVGIKVCSPDGSATVCSATPGAPSAEFCDHFDNDCDGPVDEDFPDKNAPCTVGLGACMAAGIRVCSPDGFSTECSAAPGAPTAEFCNGIDEDCDGLADNGATCAPLPNAQSTACQSGGCIVVTCAAGFFNCDGNHANGCETMGSGCP